MAEAPASKKPSSLLKAALNALSQGNAAEAISCCKHVLKQDRGNYDALVVLGKALFLNKQYDQAEQSYRRAVHLNKSGIKAWQGLAEVHEATGNSTKVVEACEAAVQIFKNAGDMVHMTEYIRRLAVASAANADHAKAHEAWEYLLEVPVISEALHLEALCGIVDAKAGIMENKIEEACRRHLSEDKTIDVASARHIAEHEWAQSEESQKMEEMLWCILNQMGDSRKHGSLLLQLLVRRMRGGTSSSGKEHRHLLLQATRLCLSLLSQHGSTDAAVIFLAICEEDNVDSIFDELGMPEFAEGRVNRLGYVGRKLSHTYPNEGPILSALVLAMHESCPHISSGDGGVLSQKMGECRAADVFNLTSLGRKRSYCEYALRMNENSIVGWQVLAELRASEGSHSSAAECIRRGLQVIARFRFLYGLTLQLAELSLQLVLGYSLLKSGAYDEACQNFQSVMKAAGSLNTTDASKLLTSASEGKAKVLLAEARVQEAAEALLLLVTDNPDNAWALAELAWLAFQKNEFEQARINLEKAVTINPENARYHYKLALLYWTSDNVLHCKGKALSHLLEAAQLDSSQYEVFRLLGHYYRDTPDGLKRALRCYQKAILLNSEDEEAGEALCDLLDSGGQELLQMTCCHEATQKSPRSFWAFRRLGYLQARRKEWPDAVRNLQHAARGYPSCANLWEALGLAYQQLGMLTAALKAYSRVIAIQGSSSVFALQQSGNILLTLRSYRKAVNMFETALEKEPEHLAGKYGMASALLGLAQECRLMGAFEWSASLLKEASHFATSGTVKHANVASLWKLLGDIEMTYARTVPWKFLGSDKNWSLLNAKQRQQLRFDKFRESVESWNKQRLLAAAKAKIAYQQALHLQPGRGNLYMDLCACLKLASNFEEDSGKLSSQAMTVEAIACSGLVLEANNVEFWTLLGTVARHKAIRQHALIQALLINGNHAVAWAHLGHMYLKDHDYQLAKEAFTHARTADPTLALPWAAMSIIYILEGCDGFEEAFASILYASQLSPIADFQLGLAQIAAKTHQLQVVQVYGAVQQAAVQVPDRPEVHNLSGLLCELMGNYEQAIESFQLARCALDCNPVLRPGYLHERKCAIVINLARCLCKAGHVQAAVEEYEMVAKSGDLEDSSALRGYATALWQLGKKALALSFSKMSRKKAHDPMEISASTILITKFAYSLSGPSAAVEEIDSTLLNTKLEISLAITTFAIASIGGLHKVLSNMMENNPLLSNHDKGAEFGYLAAVSLQLGQGFPGDLDYGNAIKSLEKTLHLYPDSSLIRTKLMQMFLEKSEGDEATVAARCSYRSLSSITLHEMNQLCQMLGATAAACSVCGKVQSCCSFSSCRPQSKSNSSTIQQLQRWMHLEPWNISAPYHLILSLMQQTREQQFPVGTCKMIQRMTENVLTSLERADHADKRYLYMEAQMMLCASEVALRSGNDRLALQRALDSTALQLSNPLKSLCHFQLAKCYAVQGNISAVAATYEKINILGRGDFLTLLSMIDLTSTYRLEERCDFPSKSYELVLPQITKFQKALLAFKAAEKSARKGDLSSAEQAALSASTLRTESDELRLLHGAIGMELSKTDSGSSYLASAVRSLSTVASSTVVKLPIASLLLAQAQASKTNNTTKWEKLIRSEWSMWPSEHKPAELYFQMGLLAKRSKGTDLTDSRAVDSNYSARSWFRRAVHLNPSCTHYWTMLQHTAVETH